VTQRRHELTSMGIRVTAETLRKQLELTGQLDFLRFPYHQAIIKNEIPLSIGGGIGQSRTQMLLLKKAHLGEVTVSVWPKILKEMSRRLTRAAGRPDWTRRSPSSGPAIPSTSARGGSTSSGRGTSAASMPRATCTSTTPAAGSTRRPRCSATPRHSSGACSETPTR
jgi:hypothetical protein